jgi:hypothetical protein
MLLATIKLARIIEGRRRSPVNPVGSGIRDVRVSDGLLYRHQRSGSWWGPSQSHFVEVDSGVPVLKIVGHHWGRRAGGTLHLLGESGQSAVGSDLLRFPVEATKPQNAVMSAVDDSGRTVL